MEDSVFDDDDSVDELGDAMAEVLEASTTTPSPLRVLVLAIIFCVGLLLLRK